MNHQCIFCAILAGKLECSLVAEDEHAMAFMDIAQINAGHVLVIPRRHAVALHDLSEDEAAATMRLVHRVAGALRESGVRCEGYNLWQANGAAAGQEVFHVHFHLIPRFEGDAVRVRIDPDRPTYDRPALDQLAAQLAAAMP